MASSDMKQTSQSFTASLEEAYAHGYEAGRNDTLKLLRYDKILRDAIKDNDLDVALEKQLSRVESNPQAVLKSDWIKRNEATKIEDKSIWDWDDMNSMGDPGGTVTYKGVKYEWRKMEEGEHKCGEEDCSHSEWTCEEVKPRRGQKERK